MDSPSATNRHQRQTGSTADLQTAQRDVKKSQSQALSALRSLQREATRQASITSDLKTQLQSRRQTASEALLRASALMDAMERPGGLWSEVAGDVAALSDGKGNVELLRALEESAAICESFIGDGNSAELVRRIDHVIEMLEGEQ